MRIYNETRFGKEWTIFDGESQIMYWDERTGPLLTVEAKNVGIENFFVVQTDLLRKKPLNI